MRSCRDDRRAAVAKLRDRGSRDGSPGMTVLRLMLLGLALLGAVAINAPLQAGLRRTGFGGAADRLQIALSRLLCAILRLTGPRPGHARPPEGRWSSPTMSAGRTSSSSARSAPLCFLAKSEVAAWPLLGAAVRAHGTLFVARRRTRRLLQVNRDMAEAMRDGRPVVLFAEGTTGNGTRLEKFHSGHFDAARDLLRAEPARPTVPVVPAALAYTRRDGLATSHRDRLALAWMGDAALLPHLLPLLRGGPVRCDLVFGEALHVGRTHDRKTVCAEINQKSAPRFSAPWPPAARVMGADNPVYCGAVRDKVDAHAPCPAARSSFRILFVTSSPARKPARAFVKSYGCQMNVYDSAKIGALARARRRRGGGHAGRRRHRRPQHLRHPRESLREGLFRTRRRCGPGNRSGARPARSPFWSSPAAWRRRRARRSSAARATSMSSSARRPITIFPRCSRAPARASAASPPISTRARNSTV